MAILLLRAVLNLARGRKPVGNAGLEMSSVEQIAENLARLKERVAAAANRAGVPHESIRIVAVTKMTSVEAIRGAIDAGIEAIGENRVQEAWSKFPEIGREVEWHLVGHLQTNKAAKAAELFDVVHSVDRFRMAEALSRHAAEHGRTLEVLIQVNTSGEKTKFGVAPQDTVALAEKVGQLPAIHVGGLMTIGPFRPDPEQARPSFYTLRKISEKIDSLGFDNIEMKWLSMGMSGDFEVAIEEGANLIRIGTSIFGPRE
ncbi:MAG: YggS family pyridoxal phosphate-dependent enzyme [Candidatus Eisenbacteria sp.]|nr:YggS family pyridoxal phosphate-dependent enzyme [Candidatus Eisenbacteria bacterium]